MRSGFYDTVNDGTMNCLAGSSDLGPGDVTSPRSQCMNSNFDLETARDPYTIDLRGEHPNAVECMVQFFYHTNYSTQAHAMNDTIDDPTQHHHLHIHSLVYKLAEVYAVDDLRALVLAKFYQTLSSAIEAADFATAAEEVYADMVESIGLRRAVIKGLHQYRKAVLQTEELKMLLYSNGIIGYDLAWYFTQKITLLQFDCSHASEKKRFNILDNYRVCNATVVYGP